jgi:glycine dehydrogenase subunit 2
MRMIFEKSVPGRRGVRTTRSDVATTINIKREFLRDKPAEISELSELDVVRHFTQLSHRNFAVDTNFYPLGSCTMKYNPKV